MITYIEINKLYSDYVLKAFVFSKYGAPLLKCSEAFDVPGHYCVVIYNKLTRNKNRVIVKHSL